MLYETVQSGYKALLVYVEKWQCSSRRVIWNLTLPNSQGNMESILARKSKATSSGEISLEPHVTSYILKAPFTSHGKHVFSYDLLA